MKDFLKSERHRIQGDVKRLEQALEEEAAVSDREGMHEMLENVRKRLEIVDSLLQRAEKDAAGEEMVRVMLAGSELEHAPGVGEPVAAVDDEATRIQREYLAELARKYQSEDDTSI